MGQSESCPAFADTNLDEKINFEYRESVEDKDSLNVWIKNVKHIQGNVRHSTLVGKIEKHSKSRYLNASFNSNSVSSYRFTGIWQDYTFGHHKE